MNFDSGMFDTMVQNIDQDSQISMLNYTYATDRHIKIFEFSLDLNQHIH